MWGALFKLKEIEINNKIISTLQDVVLNGSSDIAKHYNFAHCKNKRNGFPGDYKPTDFLFTKVSFQFCIGIRLYSTLAGLTYCM